MPSGAAFGSAPPWALEARRMMEERNAAEYATLIPVSYPRRLPSAMRHRPHVRTQARIARPGAGGRGQVLREPVGGARRPARMSW
jgi:hypothetical protein